MKVIYMYGLVLEGGGSRGAYHIGACKALMEKGIEISCIAGTSVGALNGAMIVQGDLDRAYEVWKDIEPSLIINFPGSDHEELNINVFKSPNIGIMIKNIRKAITDGGLDINPLVRLVKSAVDEDVVRKSPMDLGIVTVDLSSRKALEVFKKDIPQGKLVDYLIASASLPGFKPITIDGKVFIDGGLYNVLPVNMVSGRGFKDIFIIRTYGPGIKRKIDATGLNMTFISPSESLGSVLDFRKERARNNLNLGYFDALKVIGELKGRRYYIKPLNDDNYFIKYFTDLSDDTISKMSVLFGIEKGTGKRVLFEHIIPKIADILEVRSNASYEDISIALIEHVAETCEVERFKVYSIEELFSEIAGKYVPVKDDFIKEIPGFLRGNELITKMVRDKIIGCIADELFKGII